jgi:hypothetical protein
MNSTRWTLLRGWLKAGRGPTVASVEGESGASYLLETEVSWDTDAKAGNLRVEVGIEETGPGGGSWSGEFSIAPDGSVVDD